MWSLSWTCSPLWCWHWPWQTCGPSGNWTQRESATCKITTAASTGKFSFYFCIIYFISSCGNFMQASDMETLLIFCLQDSLASSVPSELADAHFLEEWERLRMHWAELDHQKKTFEKERQSFTDAAIRLSHEVRKMKPLTFLEGCFNCFVCFVVTYSGRKK